MDIKAAGVNHFTWIVDIRDRRTGEDLYPALRQGEAISGAQNLYQLALNLPNIGQIANLPLGAIVETPGVLSGMGSQPVAVGALPEGVAELLRRELTVAKLCADVSVSGDRQLALQCLLLDPVITDLDLACQILDNYPDEYRQYLPQFWK